MPLVLVGQEVLREALEDAAGLVDTYLLVGVNGRDGGEQLLEDREGASA
jgi:hypothetical protein